MSEFQLINNSYPVPSPKYSFGDTLQHTFTFPAGRFVLVGKVISRNYCEDAPDAGYWEYEVQGDAQLSNGNGVCNWSEHIPEDELTAYIPVSVALPQAA